MNYNGLEFCRALSNISGLSCSTKQAAWALGSRSRSAWNMHFRPLVPYLKILGLQSSTIMYKLILILKFCDTLYNGKFWRKSSISVLWYGNSYHHQSVLLKGRYFTANSGTKAAVLPEGRSSTANSGTQPGVLLGMNRCGSFPLLSAPHSLFDIWTDLKRSIKIPGAPAWRWGEWIWLTGHSGLHRNSPQGLHLSSIRVID